MLVHEKGTTFGDLEFEVGFGEVERFDGHQEAERGEGGFGVPVCAVDQDLEWACGREALLHWGRWGLLIPRGLILLIAAGGV